MVCRQPAYLPNQVARPAAGQPDQPQLVTTGDAGTATTTLSQHHSSGYTPATWPVEGANKMLTGQEQCQAQTQDIKATFTMRCYDIISKVPLRPHYKLPLG